MAGDLKETILQTALPNSLSQLGFGLTVAAVEDGKVKDWGWPRLGHLEVSRRMSRSKISSTARCSARNLWPCESQNRNIRGSELVFA
jgi:hypothetical protein